MTLLSAAFCQSLLDSVDGHGTRATSARYFQVVDRKSKSGIFSSRRTKVIPSFLHIFTCYTETREATNQRYVEPSGNFATPFPRLRSFTQSIDEQPDDFGGSADD
jgi:hypothetical protein